MCPLFSLASGLLNALNPSHNVTLRVCTGQQLQKDYTLAPEYREYRVWADLQSLTSTELSLSQNMSQQAETLSAYLKFHVPLLNRALQTGSSFMVLEDGSEWLISQLLEQWGGENGWCKVLITRKLPASPPAAAKQD